MYNYYTDLIWAIDKILLYLLVLGGAAVILYSMIRDARWKMRERALLNIKRNIYELVLSGADKRACLLAVSRITPEQFIDVATNRNREAIFFNASEQGLLKSCFVSPEKLAAIEKTALSSWSKWRRVEAILTLGYAQSERSVSALKKTINDRDPDISYFSILALGQIKNTHSARALLGFVKKRQFYRHRIFSLLEAFPPEIAEEVSGFIGHPDPARRGWAVRLLCRLGAVQYLKRIEQLTEDDSPQVRAAACACLGEFGRKSSGDSIAKRLKDDSWMVRAAGLKALFKVWGKEGLPRIMELINDGSLAVIEGIKWLIVENMEECFPYVEEFLSSGDEIARRVAVEALEASGYLVKIFRDMLAGSPEERGKRERLLKGLTDSLAYAGIEAALLRLPADERRKVLDIIRKIDEPAARVLEENILRQEGRPL